MRRRSRSTVAITFAENGLVVAEPAAVSLFKIGVEGMPDALLLSESCLERARSDSGPRCEISPTRALAERGTQPSCPQRLFENE